MTTQTPEPFLEVVIGTTAVRLKMFYGMLDRLLKEFKDEGAADVAMLDNELRNKVLAIVLKKRGEFGHFTEKLTEEAIEDLDMTADDISRIFKWVLEHVTDFFIRFGEGAKATVEKFGARSDSLNRSETGSEA